MTICCARSIVKGDLQHRVAISLRCRSWLCPNCTDRRKAQLTAEAIGGAPRTFLTLTSRRRDNITPEAAAKRLSHAWRLLRLRTMRKYKLRRLPFLAVVEATEAGWPHLHILLRAPWLSKKWLSEQMQQLDDSPILEIKKIDNVGRVAGYCAKYCTKCTHKFGTTKRYWQSQDYDLRPDQDPKKRPLPGTGWEQHRDPVTRIVRGWLELGWYVKQQSQWRAECWPQGPP